MGEKENRLPPFPAPGADYIRYRLSCDVPGMVYRFRKTFDLDAIPGAAFLRLTGFTRYAVWVNGSFIGRGPLTAGRYCATYDVFPIERMLHTGRNAIAIQLMVGLYYGQFLEPAPWIGGGLIADLCLDDGSALLVSDGTWKCDLDRAYGFHRPRRNIWRPFLEIFDARKDQPRWREADFDDASWPACRTGAPRPTILSYEERPAPGFEYEIDERMRFASSGRVRWRRDPEEWYWLADPESFEAVGDSTEGVTNALRPGEYFRGVALEANPDEALFFRLICDEYALGRPFFELVADEGLMLDVVWAERKKNPEPMLSPCERMANWARYITRTGQQRFTFFDIHGFKELQFTLQPGRGKVRFVRVGVERQWAMRCDKGSFRASDERYGMLWKAGARTVACVTTDHHCDNTFREQAPWSGDQEWTKMGAYVAEGVHPITTRQFRQFLKGQTRDGRFVSPYPHPFPYIFLCDAQKQQTTGDYLPCHALGFILSLGRHYMYSGDPGLIREAWPHLERQVAQFEETLDKHALIDLRRIAEAWIWVDWQGLKDRTAPINALWGGALRTMAELAQVIGKDPAPYWHRFERVKDSFIRRFWDSERNLFVDRPFHRPELGENLSQLTQAIAACFDLLPEGADRARLAADLTALDGRLGVATPPMQGFVLCSLEKLKAEERIHSLLEVQWLHPQMFAMGTLPEFWPDSERKHQAICQGGGPVISWALTYYVLGVRPLAAGFEKFTVKPVPGSLQSAEGTCPTPHGPIRASWRRTDEGVKISVVTPAGCQYVEAPTAGAGANAR